ncbi:MAG: pyruvate carboxylase [Sporomusaceae bacterium]|jgi:pyruvate carboxylase|nr:pyruvate carboxylase [Sporomusaceae bacterium]
MKKIKTVLVANRGEIAIRIFRACQELNIHTIAIYSKEDIYSLHRYKADEAYLIGQDKGPVEAYLDIDGIIEIAKANNVDAIHPGYGFLSENINLAKRCHQEGIIFIGPGLDHLHMFGDKINARNKAIEASLPVIPGSDGPIAGLKDAEAFGAKYGYPFIIKAVLGGGGRGMRIVYAKEELETAYDLTRSEAQTSFGNDEIYLEKFIESPKHIEVQILGDKYGKIVHLYERDCSIQRRHQKVIEIAPAVSISDKLRQEICGAAVSLMQYVGYYNAGTVEFLVSPDEKFYFIEVNPRIQVEHTITEMITGLDLVQAQILIADGCHLSDEEIGITSQESIALQGHAIQCRITTEDPARNFMPDVGKINVYRSVGGFGVRIDVGNAFTGAVITPHYDSLLVKASVCGLTHKSAIAKMKRILAEYRIRGVKTNIAFLNNIISHPAFLAGTYNTGFLDASPDLFHLPKPKDRGTKIIHYLGEVIVNGYDGQSRKNKPDFKGPRLPAAAENTPSRLGTKQILDTQGPAGLVEFIKNEPKVLLTDTTFRDAHQSLLATRMRTYDMLKVIGPTAVNLPELFSFEMWGGATFDVAYRFLKEDPWQRLKALREKCPNILFQMLFRGSNAVGYNNYPDNLIRAFIRTAAQNGIDVFRIFDSLNWVEAMKVAIEEVRACGKVAEASMCYAGDILDKSRAKYDLAYYVNLAKELEKTGAHILNIKDMAGILKPEAAYRLISALKDAVDLPIHLHTHDTGGNGNYTYTKAIDAGVDIVDVAIASVAGMASQPSASSLYYALEGNSRQPDINIDALTKLSHYWQDVRGYYQGFDGSQTFPSVEIYKHEMPGGQHSNLQQQAYALGLSHEWDKIKKMYTEVNKMFGDIIKVTPSSKVVGDMALFMVENNLTENEIYETGHRLNFPNSVVEFFQGFLGQPYQGFPEKLQKVILKEKKALTTRPGESLEAVNFAEVRQMLSEKFSEILNRAITDEDVLSYCLYPKVFSDWANFRETYDDLSVLDTPAFFYGLKPGEIINLDIEKGKTLFIKFVSKEPPSLDGKSAVNFEINGLARQVIVRDTSMKNVLVTRIKADKNNNEQIGADMSGKVVKVLAESGKAVKRGEALLIIEAMKMETTVQVPFNATIKNILVKAGDVVESGDLLLELTKVEFDDIAQGINPI